MSESPEASSPGLDLRIARVVEARDHPNADRLMVLGIDLGEEMRQIVAGLVGHYAPADVQGQKIVVVANLQPARLRGEISQGMLLAAEDGEGNLGLLTAPDAEPGTRLAAAGAQEPAGELSFAQFQAHTLHATAEGVTLNGAPITGASLVMDRQVYGRLR